MSGYRHVFHLYIIETKKPEQRDPFLKFLNDAGIDAKTHYSIAIHQQAGYPWGKGARVVGPLTNASAMPPVASACRCFPS
jgi:dTDP-4-amino-4,6-dideoxygalactose transaminase